MRKFYCILCVLSITVILVGCVDSSVRSEAKSYKNQYEKEYKSKVETEFGKDAVLTDIQGEIESSKDPLFSQTHYKASGKLQGIIHIGDKTYDSVYDPLQKKLLTDMNIDKIEQSMLALLPLDTAQIVDVFMYSNANYDEKLLFESNITDIKQILAIQAMGFVIETNEDISGFTEEDFNGLTEISYEPYKSYSIEIKYKDNVSNTQELYVTPLIKGGYSVIK